MRILIPILAVIWAATNVALTREPAAVDSSPCVAGLCRFDQIAASIDSSGVDTSRLQTLLTLTPADPLAWATYGEFLAQQGDPRAGKVFDHAVQLGPNITAVLMRTANFDFTHNRQAHGLALTRKILSQTGLFDQILFSYLTSAQRPARELLNVAIPAESRAAESWWSWLRTHGTEQDLDATWAWMVQNRLVKQRLAIESVSAYWDRKQYLRAQQIWRQWIGGQAGDYLNPELVWNPRFSLEPTSSPLDWVIERTSSAAIERVDGLEVRFSGTDNIQFTHVHQTVPLRPGRYVFAADLEASGLTTDSRPRLRIGSEIIPIDNLGRRTTVRREFSVPVGASTVEIRLERQPSERFDSKLRGNVHLYSVSVKPL